MPNNDSGVPNVSNDAYITLIGNRAFGCSADSASVRRPPPTSTSAAQAEPVVQLLFGGPQGVPAPIERAGGCVDLDPTLADAIVAHPRQYYVNIHTAEFPAGAIRAQIRRDQGD